MNFFSRFSRFSFISALLIAVVSSLFCSCSGMLNDMFDDASERIADAAGVVYPTTTDSSTVSGTLPTSDSYIIYSFEAKKGVTYTISLANVGDARMNFSYPSSSSDYLSTYNSSSVTYTAYEDGTRYITVDPYSSSYTGSFSLSISCKNSSVSLSTYKEHIYHSATAETATLERVSHYYIYKFYAHANTEYTVSWVNGSNANMYVSAGVSTESLTDYFYQTTTSGLTLTPKTDGYVYVKVNPVSASTTGDVTLTVSNYAYAVSLEVEENYSYSDTVSASIPNSDGYYIYSFSAVSGVSYTVSWENGDNATMSVSAGSSQNSPTSYFSATTTSGQTITPSSNGTVYIKVAPQDLSSTGSFSLTVSNNSKSVTIEEVEKSVLYSDTVSGTISYDNGYYIYSFSVSSGSTYTVSWTNGSGATMSVSAGSSSSYLSTFFSATTPSSQTITPSYSGTVYIKIAPQDSSSTGDFTLTVTSSDSDISLTQSSYSTGYAVTDLTPNTTLLYTTGTLSSSVQSIIYRFSATAGTTYTIWWGDSYQGLSGTDTVDVKVSASTSSTFSTTLFSNVDSGYNSGRQVSLSSGGYVYIKVVPYYSGKTGTFRIAVVKSSY